MKTTFFKENYARLTAMTSFSCLYSLISLSLYIYTLYSALTVTPRTLYTSIIYTKKTNYIAIGIFISPFILLKYSPIIIILLLRIRIFLVFAARREGIKRQQQLRRRQHEWRIECFELNWIKSHRAQEIEWEREGNALTWDEKKVDIFCFLRWNKKNDEDEDEVEKKNMWNKNATN